MWRANDTFGNVVSDNRTCHEARLGETLEKQMLRVFGGAALELRTDGAADAFETDIARHTAAAGAHGVFLRRDGGLELTGRMDAHMVRIDSDTPGGRAGNLVSMSLATSRVRFVLEGTRPFDLGADRMLMSALELGVRIERRRHRDRRHAGLSSLPMSWTASSSTPDTRMNSNKSAGIFRNRLSPELPEGSPRQDPRGADTKDAADDLSHLFTELPSPAAGGASVALLRRNRSDFGGPLASLSCAHRLPLSRPAR